MSQRLLSSAQLRYRVFIKYCVFSLKFCDCSELCQFCCSAGVSTHTDTEGNREKQESGIYFKIFGKKRYLMNTLYYNFFIIINLSISDPSQRTDRRTEKVVKEVHNKEAPFLERKEVHNNKKEKNSITKKLRI